MQQYRYTCARLPRRHRGGGGTRYWPVSSRTRSLRLGRNCCMCSCWLPCCGVSPHMRRLRGTLACSGRGCGDVRDAAPCLRAGVGAALLPGARDPGRQDGERIHTTPLHEVTLVAVLGYGDRRTPSVRAESTTWVPRAGLQRARVTLGHRASCATSWRSTATRCWRARARTSGAPGSRCPSCAAPRPTRASRRAAAGLPRSLPCRCRPRPARAHGRAARPANTRFYAQSLPRRRWLPVRWLHVLH